MMIMTARTLAKLKMLTINSEFSLLCLIHVYVIIILILIQCKDVKISKIFFNLESIPCHNNITTLLYFTIMKSFSTTL